MKTTSAQRMAALRERRKAQGLKELTGIWVTDKEKAIIKPMIEDKLKELREKDSKK